MRLDPDQLEWIVREVLRRLQQQGMQAAAVPTGRELALENKVVATAQLDGKLQGVGRVVVNKAAVVTPAVVDLLKERKVDLIRKTA